MTDNTRVYNCDCQKGMAAFDDGYFDLAIVDPPYKGDVSGLNVGTGKRDFNYANFAAPSSEYIAELFRVSKNQIIWGFNYFLELLKNTDGFVCWYKHQNGHFSECELAWCSSGNGRYYSRPYQLDIGNKIHPTQKPVALYKWLLKNYAKEGDKILDTHGGSMSSVIACLEMGFSITCYEKDPDYYQAAKKRIEQYLAQGNLFKEKGEVIFG